MEWISTSTQYLEIVAKDILRTLNPRNDRATVLGLSGNLGTGKTTFTQTLASLLGVRERVTSPTFIIEKIYALERSGFKHLIHIDVYRLENSQELITLGWETLLSNPSNLILLEWPEKVSDILPSDTIYLQFEYIDETTRKITLHTNGNR